MFKLAVKVWFETYFELITGSRGEVPWVPEPQKKNKRRKKNSFFLLLFFFEALVPRVGGRVLGLRTYREVPLENLKSYPVPESITLSGVLNNTPSFSFFRQNSSLQGKLYEICRKKCGNIVSQAI